MAASHFTALAGGVALLFAQAPAPVVPSDVEQYLLKAAGFSKQEVAALEQGTVIARVAEGTVGTEVIAVAAVRIRATRQQVVSYYGQMIAYVDGEVTKAFGRFGTPPSAGDVQGLRLDAGEIDHLRSCRAGDCDLRIGGTAIDTFRSAIDWNAADASDQANARVRDAVVSYVAQYMKRGDEALVTYNDRAQPISLRQQWQDILAASPYFQQYSPALREYLAQYPQRPLQGAKDVLYWIYEQYTGLKPVLSIVHGVIYDDPAAPGRTTIAQKQLYASHYYDGSLAVAVAIAASEGADPVTYLVYANRSRGDLLKGGFGGLKRTVARNQAKSAAQQTLGTIKQVLESQR